MNTKLVVGVGSTVVGVPLLGMGIQQRLASLETGITIDESIERHKRSVMLLWMGVPLTTAGIVISALQAR